MTDLPGLSTLDVRGKFRLEVTYLRGTRPQRITIAGSDGSDGAYEPSLGMTLDIAGAAWRCGSLWLYSGSWVKSYWLFVDYKVRIPAGLVIEVQGQNGALLVGAPPPPIDVRWTLTNTNPATALPPITGLRPDFSLGEQAGVIVGVPAAEAAAGTPLVKLP